MAHECRKWVHTELSGFEAERLLLEKGVPGSFLVRQSQGNRGHFTLSVRRESSFAHIRIENTGDFLNIPGSEKFANLSELLNYYLENRGQLKEKNGAVIDLLYPVFVDDIVLESARWFHGHITANEAHILLKDKGKNGSFLVRESIRQPGSYVLSVLTGDTVSHILICRKPNSKFDIGGGPQFSSVSQLIDYYSRFPMMDKNGGLVFLKQPFNATRLNLSTLEKRIAQLEKQSTCGHYLPGFLEEFEELHQNSNEASRSEGSRAYNKSRNRFKHILPYDSTRVILRDSDPQTPGSDYINANYIYTLQFLGDANLVSARLENFSEIDHPKNPQYIATQGILPETVTDFWRMVWNERSSIIVMLVKETERGRNRCSQYWPNATDGTFTLPHNQGDLHITHVSERNMKTYVIRELQLCRDFPSCSAGNFTAYHFQYTAWPEEDGTPSDPSSLLNFMCCISTHQETVPTTGPMIVHCSSGIGRTGTFIAIDQLINCVKDAGLHVDIDIARTVQTLRLQRAGMVQTEAQYRFIYKAVQEFVSRMLLRVQLRNALQPYGVDYTNLRPTPSDGCLACTAPTTIAARSSLPVPFPMQAGTARRHRGATDTSNFQPYRNHHHSRAPYGLGESAPCSSTCFPQPPAQGPATANSSGGVSVSSSPQSLGEKKILTASR